VSQLAYLVIREGAKWSDVFRLVPGQAVTIGRAPTNQIVLKDERCSRNHLEVFLSAGQWMLRDLDSRNGTLIGTQRVSGDWPLQPGDTIRIGKSQLVFVHRLAEAFADSTSVMRPVADKEGAAAGEEEDANVLAVGGPTTITHRRGQTRFLEPGEEEDVSAVSKMGQAAARLCRLAFELAKARTRRPWPTWRWPAWPRARRPTPGPSCCCPTTFAARRGRRPWRSWPRTAPPSVPTIRSPPCWPPP